jgi:phosphatidylglycerol lysyltransferase
MTPVRKKAVADTKLTTASSAEQDSATSPIQRIVMPLISFGLFFVALAAIHHILGEVSYAQLIAELTTLTYAQLGLAVLFTIASFLALSGYDWAALAYIGRRLPYHTVALATFCSYAFANTVGLGLVSGGSVRYRVYVAAGLDAADVARVTVFSALGLGIGLYLVAAAALVVHPDLVAGFFGLSPTLLSAIGILALVVLAAFVALTFLKRAPIRLGPWQFQLPSGLITVFQLGISALDIVFAGACLYVLLPAPVVPFLAFLGVYAVAVTVGLVSHVPGGLGVFESVMLLALRGSIPAETLTLTLIAYRAIYYLLPLILAIVILAGREVMERVPPVTAAVRHIRSWSAKLVPSVLAGLAFFDGVVLLVSAATPAVPARLEALKELVPLAVIEVSDILAAVLGLVLLIIARGLYRKLNGAYVLALVSCLAGSILSIAKGIDYEEGLSLFGTALVLFSCRREFYRRTAFMDSPFTPGWILSILATVGGMYWLIMFSYKHVEYAHALWWQFGYHSGASRSLRAGLAVTIGLIIMGVTQLLQPPRRRPGLPSTADLNRAEAITRAQDDTDANLALMGDKHLLFSEAGDAFLMFGVWHSSWIAMGDPIGPPEVADELAWRFRELADREGKRVAF